MKVVSYLNLLQILLIWKYLKLIKTKYKGTAKTPTDVYERQIYNNS